jgi:NAD(P)-dependent dehydrogenase (short-subunit alcohol dehydrogenase family)
MGKLEKKVAVITGSTSGIGRACAERFAAEGARVVVSGRRRSIGEALAKSLGGDALFVAADVAKPADVENLAARALERFGQIDCWISNAGGVSTTSTVTASSPQAFDHDLTIHVRAPFLALRIAGPAMAARGTGSFIHMSSISGSAAGFNPFGYEVAKAALLHLTRCAALELGEKGVRVNAISPGPTTTGIFVKSDGSDSDSADARTDDVRAAFEALLPSVQAVPGMIQASDIAAAALFLASDDARYVNGHDLVVDGGITAGRPASTMAAGWSVLAKALS